MKRLAAALLAVSLCLAAIAPAETVPSKANPDLTRFAVEAENQPGDGDIYLLPLHAAMVGEMLPDSQARIDLCEAEIGKLAASATVEDYFGSVTDAAGNEVDLRELLGAGEDARLNVFEFCPAIAGGFREECGRVTATMLFSTPYGENQSVVVMVGIVTISGDGSWELAWRAFEGIGLGGIGGDAEGSGAIRVELTPETIHAIQDGMALLAVVSAEAGAA